MATSWEKKRLGDLAMIIMGQSPKSEYYNNRGDGLPFFQGNRDFGELHPSPSTYCSLPSKIALPKDILMSVRAPVGALNLAAEECCIGRGLCAIRPNRSGRFIFYLLKANIENIHAAESGAVFGAVNKADLNSLLLLIPSDEQTQDKIAAILSAYDELIENNLRRIKILEEMGQTIYREWFVKFRFPGHQNIKMVDSPLGKIPEGWEVSALGSLCTLIKEPYREEPHFSFPLIDLARIPQKTLLASEVGSPKELSTSRIIFSPDDVLFGAIRPYLHKVILAPTNGVTNVSVFVLRSREEINKPFVAVLLSMEDSVRWADQYSTGTKMPVIKWDVFQQMKVLIPKKEVIRGFYDVVWPMMQLIKNTFLRNSNLRQTRDFLLPKLISGELDVSELDIKIAETERN